MERLTCDNPQTNTEHLLNFAYAKNGRVHLRWADGREDADLCEYIVNNACCTEVDAEAVMDGACLECDSRVSTLYRVAVQAAELRARLAAYEDTGLMPAEVRSLWGEWNAMISVLNSIGSYDRLRELAEADKDGRALVLPCKENTLVWKISHRINGKHEIEQKYFNLTYSRIEDFGKTLFLTREEAEAALKEVAE